jgi:hypothetical protein
MFPNKLLTFPKTLLSRPFETCLDSDFQSPISPESCCHVLRLFQTFHNLPEYLAGPDLFTLLMCIVSSVK